jgi:hypothetical protein
MLVDFGYKEAELLGKSIKLSIGAEHADTHDGYIQQYLQTGSAQLMGTKRAIPARRKDGTEFPILNWDDRRSSRTTTEIECLWASFVLFQGGKEGSSLKQTEVYHSKHKIR